MRDLKKWSPPRERQGSSSAAPLLNCDFQQSAALAPGTHGSWVRCIFLFCLLPPYILGL